MVYWRSSFAKSANRNFLPVLLQESWDSYIGKDKKLNDSIRVPGTLVQLVWLVVRKIFSQVTTYPGLISALVYPWYTNEEWPSGGGCRICRLHLCRGVRPPPMSILYMTLNNLMVRFQWCWRFGECGAHLHCHCSQVHSGPKW